MATFLGIYSKKNKLNSVEVESCVTNFSLNNTRAICHKEIGGVLFCFANQFAHQFYQSKHGFTFLSGHISFQYPYNRNLAENTTEQLCTYLTPFNKNTLTNLEGAFVGIHYNTKEHSLYLFNDKFGMLPLFIYENENYLAFSNEYQALTSLLNSKSVPLNKIAIAEYLTMGSCLGNKTFIKNISNLNAGTFIQIRHSTVHEEPYWKPQIKLRNENPEQLAKELLDTFTQINREYLNTNHTQLCLLSAGADSRLILATMTEQQRKTKKFYTSNLSFLDEDKDAIGASLLSAKFKLNHEVKKISFYEDQFSSSYFNKERELRDKQVYGGWHGGEFLGAYFLKAAPINRLLTFDEVDLNLRNIFSFRFRFALRKHPYHSYREEKNKLDASNNEIMFFIHQMTRSFFSSIYSGTRGHWVQPYQLTNHGLSPFWDSRFLQKLIAIPVSLLRDYNLYNEIFKLCEKEFTSIPSNSPLTNRTDSIIPKLETGFEPKHQLPNTHRQVYLQSLNNPGIWNKNLYNEKKLKEILKNELHPISKRWLDYEMWYSYMTELNNVEKHSELLI